MSAADGAGAGATLAEAFASIPELRDQMARVLAALEDHAAAERVRAAVDGGLHPDHAYSPDQVASLLGITRASVLKVSKDLLPRVRSGRVLGIDVMAYRGDVTAQEAAAYKAGSRDRVRTGALRAATRRMG